VGNHGFGNHNKQMHPHEFRPSAAYVYIRFYLLFEMFQIVHQYKTNDFENALNNGKQNSVVKKQCFGLETDQTTKPLIS